MMNEQRLTHKKVYECFFMELFEDDVLLPNNKQSKRIYIEHPGAAAVLPITTDKKVLLIRQFRYPIHGVTIEVPAGKKDFLEESGLACVKREIEEETGYQSDHIESWITMHSCLGYSNEYIELLFAHDIYPVAEPLEGDDDEFIEPFFASVSEVQQLLKSNQVTDAKTIILLQEFIRRYA
jgi:ADP-ribose pyrophosphatase